MIFRRKREVVYLTERLAQALVFGEELYAFVVDELDPDPHPAQAYVRSPAAQEGAKIIQRLFSARQRSTPGLVSHERKGGPTWGLPSDDEWWAS